MGFNIKATGSGSLTWEVFGVNSSGVEEEVPVAAFASSEDADAWVRWVLEKEDAIDDELEALGVISVPDEKPATPPDFKGFTEADVAKADFWVWTPD